MGEAGDNKPPVQSRVGLVLLIPFRRWMMMMMSRQPQRGTERCCGKFLGMGRRVKCRNKVKASISFIRKKYRRKCHCY